MNKKYQILYADPPWSYRVWTAKGGHKSASAHYNTMSLDDICALNVANLADENCALFMWATYPNLREAFTVLDAWGFTFKTVAFTWVKLNKKAKTPFVGLGHWSRANAEICLLATRGKPKRVDKGVRQLILTEEDDELCLINDVVFADRREHSRKPDETRDRIIQLMGDIPRIELFARQSVLGWDVIGNEIDGKDIVEVINLGGN